MNNEERNENTSRTNSLEKENTGAPSTTLKHTPLFEEHLALGARMVPFAGWEMPVQYEGLRQEHTAVRTHVGLFDVSHMGEVRVQGPHALSTLEWLTTNSVEKLENGQAQYSLLTNEQGGIVDDIIIYCVEKNKDYLVCVNAANKDKDFQWMLKHNQQADITDESDRWAQIAVQGPNAWTLLQRIFSTLHVLKKFEFTEVFFDQASCYLANTGYTGEEGCEIFIPNSAAAHLWKQLLIRGEDLGVAPIGLGARDTLRTEMKYSLYGHEIDDTTNPYMAGLGWVVKADKKNFIGKEKIMQQKEQGLTQSLIGFTLLEKGIPRAEYSLFSFDNQEVGRVTSGTLSPTLNESIGIAYIRKDLATVDSEFYVDIRGKKIKAKVVKTPFVK